MSNDALFGDGGQLTRRNVKVEPAGESTKVQDVLDELYEVLLRRGYALCQGNFYDQHLIVLCKQRDGMLEPVAQVAQIVPGKGIDWRAVSGEKPKPEVKQ